MTTGIDILVMRGSAREDDLTDELRAESICNMGVGCTPGKCYAALNGHKELCGIRNFRTERDFDEGEIADEEPEHDCGEDTCCCLGSSCA